MGDLVFIALVVSIYAVIGAATSVYASPGEFDPWLAIAWPLVWVVAILFTIVTVIRRLFNH